MTCKVHPEYDEACMFCRLNRKMDAIDAAKNGEPHPILQIEEPSTIPDFELTQPLGGPFDHLLGIDIYAEAYKRAFE